MEYALASTFMTLFCGVLSYALTTMVIAIIHIVLTNIGATSEGFVNNIVQPVIFGALFSAGLVGWWLYLISRLF